MSIQIQKQLHACTNDLPGWQLSLVSACTLNKYKHKYLHKKYKYMKIQMQLHALYKWPTWLGALSRQRLHLKQIQIQIHANENSNTNTWKYKYNYMLIQMTCLAGSSLSSAPVHLKQIPNTCLHWPSALGTVQIPDNIIVTLGQK